MAEVKDRNTNRRLLFIAVIILTALILLVKIFTLQVIDKSYRLSAENNVLRYVTQYPARGLVYDRNGELLVYNQAAYDLMVIPGQMSEIDTAELCSIVNISRDSYNDRIKKAWSYSEYAPSVFLKMISSETYGRLQESLYKYPGFYVQTRTLRKYTHPSSSHVLGY
ncbi:MAG: penicillin-binding protein 2, partial [Bacteroidales bacterium]|nr:penicillin-binding protein 2 [Bacteroidales bacterium]